MITPQICNAHHQQQAINSGVSIKQFNPLRGREIYAWAQRYLVDIHVAEVLYLL